MNNVFETEKLRVRFEQNGLLILERNGVDDRRSPHIINVIVSVIEFYPH